MMYLTRGILFTLFMRMSMSITLNADPVPTGKPAPTQTATAPSTSEATSAAPAGTSTPVAPASNAKPAGVNASTSATAAPTPEAKPTVSDAKNASSNCVTRKDPRAEAWWTLTAPEGTACVFGVDPRDEGTHCIPEFEYGSNGWCFTDAARSTWGSCGGNCPLYGPHKVLGDIIDGVSEQLGDLTAKMDTASAEVENAASTAPSAAAPATPAAIAPDAQAQSKNASMLAFKAMSDIRQEENTAAPMADAKTPASEAPQKQPTAAATAAADAPTDKAPNSSVTAAEKVVPPLATPANSTTETRSNACVTKKDPRASAWWAVTSPEGSPCMFGVDARDEGSHCIQDGLYGSNGWCFTSGDASSWGSCAESCPLSGANKILGAKIDSVAKQLGNLSNKVAGAGATAGKSEAPANAAGDAKAQAKTASMLASRVIGQTEQEIISVGPSADASNKDVSPAKADTTAAAATAAAATAAAAPTTEAPHDNAKAAEKAAPANACVTKKDPRATAWWATTSPEGSPCIFGVDARDEGSHCIQEILYGSNGWCFTTADASTWGSCGGSCPLSGPNKILGSKIDSVANQLSNLKSNIPGQEAPVDGKTPPVDAQPSAAPANAAGDAEAQAKASMFASAVSIQSEQETNSLAPSSDANSTNTPAAKADATADAATAAAVTADVASTTVAPHNNATAESVAPVHACVTRKDPRATAWWAATSPAGSPCIFGVDARDEGSHCIQETIYGSNGWCFTSVDASTWGSCSESCPLSGPNKILGAKIDSVAKQLGNLTSEVHVAEVQAPTLATSPGASTESAAPAATAAGANVATAPAKSKSLLASGVVDEINNVAQQIGHLTDKVAGATAKKPVMMAFRSLRKAIKEDPEGLKGLAAEDKVELKHLSDDNSDGKATTVPGIMLLQKSSALREIDVKVTEDAYHNVEL